MTWQAYNTGNGDLRYDTMDSRLSTESHSGIFTIAIKPGWQIGKSADRTANLAENPSPEDLSDPIGGYRGS